MKKIIIGIFVLTLFMVMFASTSIYAATPTLEQIADKFNNCETVKDYATNGLTWLATSSTNKINVTTTYEDESNSYDYILDGSILIGTFSSEEAFGGLLFGNYLVDSVGQLYGYSDGEVLTNLTAVDITKYTIEKEGLEVKELSDGGSQIKIDIAKKTPLIDLSNVYIEPSDLEKFKNTIAGEGSCQQSKGNITFNKSGYDGENTIRVAEKGKLTQNTYKSILSIIEVMFGSEKATEYFKANYNDISLGNKEFTGFKIEVNPVKDDLEKFIIDDSGYEFVRITIDKNIANQAINSDVSNENNENVNELPKAGIEFNYATALKLILIVACLGASAILLTTVFKKKENK